MIMAVYLVPAINVAKVVAALGPTRAAMLLECSVTDLHAARKRGVAPGGLEATATALVTDADWPKLLEDRKQT